MKKILEKAFILYYYTVFFHITQQLIVQNNYCTKIIKIQVGNNSGEKIEIKFYFLSRPLESY